VPQRIQFKVALTYFDCVHGSGPAYFRDVCIPFPVVDISSRFDREKYGGGESGSGSEAGGCRSGVVLQKEV